MTITFADGRTVNGIVLSQVEDSMRVALEGADDILEFTKKSGTVVSEDCEAVRIASSLDRRLAEPPAVSDCICSKELAAHLLHLLLQSSDEPEWRGRSAAVSGRVALPSLVV